MKFREIGKLSTGVLIIILMVAILGALLLAISQGSVDIPTKTVYLVVYNEVRDLLGFSSDSNYTHGVMYNIVWIGRLPRVVMAAIVGATLALAGVVMQATVQNPLADPYILGMSSGASFGATFSIACGASAMLESVFGNNGVAFWAFLGSFASAVAVLLLSSAGGRTTSVKLVLSGTIISSLFGAFSNLIITLYADAEDMQSITFWSLGSFGSADWDKIALVFTCFFLILLYFITQIRTLNVMLTGDETAATLGIDLNRKRKIYVFMCAILTAVAVCFCGIIGFVGLMIPHIVRAFTGNNHWKLLPLCVLTGSLFMILADMVARIILDHGELPIGIITAVCGAPVFAYIMLKKAYTFS